MWFIRRIYQTEAGGQQVAKPYIWLNSPEEEKPLIVALKDSQSGVTRSFGFSTYWGCVEMMRVYKPYGFVDGVRPVVGEGGDGDIQFIIAVDDMSLEFLGYVEKVEFTKFEYQDIGGLDMFCNDDCYFERLDDDCTLFMCYFDDKECACTLFQALEFFEIGWCWTDAKLYGGCSVPIQADDTEEEMMYIVQYCNTDGVEALRTKVKLGYKSLLRKFMTEKG